MSSHIQRHGIRVCRNRKYQRFQCMNCATLFQGASIPREKRP
jgi:transposase-like protein